MTGMLIWFGENRGAGGIPSFLNNGVVSGGFSGSSVTLNLPTSRVNGAFLIGSVRTLGTGTHSWPADWTEIFDNNGATGYSWAYRFVDGTETDPTVTFAGSCTRKSSVISQWSNVNPTTPIGATSFQNSSGTGKTHSGFSTLNDGSLALMYLAKSGSNAPGSPTAGWDLDFQLVCATDNHACWSKSMASAGSTGSWAETDSDTFSYGVLGFELRGSA